MKIKLIRLANYILHRLRNNSLNSLKSVKNIETARKHFLINLFSSIGIFFMTLFGVTALYQGNYGHSLFLLIIPGIQIFNFIYFKLSGKHQIPAIITIVLMGCLEVFLLVTGGINNTGPLWFYVFPLLVFFVAGLKTGIILTGMLFVITLCVFYIPNLPFVFTVYTTAFQGRLLASFVAVSIMSGVYEFSRFRVYTHLLDLSFKLDKAARTDHLTGLSNRRDIQEHIQYEITRFKRSGTPFCILISDIDHFKKINDSYGHSCGDVILQNIAELMSGSLRKQDLIARWGGEEFLFFLPDTGLDGGVIAAEKLRQKIRDHVFFYQDQEIRLTMSFGVHVSNTHGSIREVIMIADRCLYTAKETGRNKVVSSKDLGKKPIF
ncbi:MAG: GGDEF domain-containing protein [Spirochaetia bacterium]